MKKKYTTRQIQEAINYWKKQLRMMNEAEDMDKELLKKAGHEAFEYVEKKVKERKRCEAGIVGRYFFDYICAEPYKFDFKFMGHAFNLGNNREWNIIKNNKVIGTLWCADDGFGGVDAALEMDGKVVEKRRF